MATMRFGGKSLVFQTEEPWLWVYEIFQKLKLINAKSNFHRGGVDHFGLYPT
jgi:hypothetical protein